VPDGPDILNDPEAAAACVAAGVRGELDLTVGAKTHNRHVSPVRLHGRVWTLLDGLFV